MKISLLINILCIKWDFTCQILKKVLFLNPLNALNLSSIT